MSPVVGVVGCGRWGMTHLKTLYNLKQQGIISAIHACDIKPSKQAEVAKFADSFYTDWQTLVNEQELDIVAIVTPADTHCDLALQILDYCKSIFIEKPIGLSQYEASLIIAKVQELGGHLLVGHILRFHEAMNQAMDLISEGEIGELQRIEFNRITPRQPPDYPNIFEAMAIHGIDTACYSFGELEPSRITVGNVVLDDNNYPTNAKLSIEFPGMKEACIDVGWNGREENRKIEYYGSKGSITVETNEVNKLTITTGQAEQTILLSNIMAPLAREWQHLIEMTKSSSKHSIYPQPGSIIRSIKWVELANIEIQNTSMELNERIE